MQRPDRSAEIREFLNHHHWQQAQYAPLAGDASFRRYFRVTQGPLNAVVMDAPPPFEDVRPFIAITEKLTQCGISVPHILAADEKNGFLLLEDFGDTIFTRVLSPSPQAEMNYYRTAIDALAVMNNACSQHKAWKEEIPPYDEAVYLREVGLFAEWFLPQMGGIAQAKTWRKEWLSLWRDILAATPLQQSVLVHRDYHADNLVWLNDRATHQRVGMLDYQDALWGDPAYDVVSLLEDARRDVATATTEQCLTHAVSALKESSDFAQRYAVLGAQRNAKIIGIFTRLCVRDNKPHYLHYLPRVWSHFLRDIAHPALYEIRNFIEANVPTSHRGAFVADTTIGGIVP